MFRLRSFATLTIIVVMSLCSVLSAQSYQPLDKPYTGEITAQSVYIRSGDRPEYYAVTRLSTPETVEVIGRSGAWLAVTPPKGVFSMISKRHVDADSSGKTGTVNTENVRVRCGSLEFPSHFSVVQTHLDTGAKVEIIGQTAEYYKITPPAGVAVYVSSAFVKKVEIKTPVSPAEEKTPVKLPAPPAPKDRTPEPKEPAEVKTPAIAKDEPTNNAAVKLPAPPETPVDASTTDLAADAAKSDFPADVDPEKVETPAVPQEPLGEAEKLLLAVEQFNQAEDILMAEYEKPQARRDLKAMLKLYESLDSAGDQALSERILYRQRYLRLAIQRLEGMKEVSSLSISNAQQMSRISSMIASISDIGSRNVSRDMTIIGRLKASSVYKGVGAMPRRWIMFDDLTGERLLYVEAADVIVNLSGNLNWKIAVTGRPHYVRDISEYVLKAHTVKKLPDGDPSKAPAAKPITTAGPIELPGPKVWEAPDTTGIEVKAPAAEPEKVLQMQNPAPLPEKAPEPAEPEAPQPPVEVKTPVVETSETPEKDEVKVQPPAAMPEAPQTPVKVDEMDVPDNKPTSTTGLPMVPATDAPTQQVDPDTFK